MTKFKIGDTISLTKSRDNYDYDDKINATGKIIEIIKDYYGKKMWNINVNDTAFLGVHCFYSHEIKNCSIIEIKEN